MSGKTTPVEVLLYKCIAFKNLLAENGFTIKRTARTVDESTAIMLNEINAWVDLYDDGDAVIVVNNGECTGFYEFAPTEYQEIMDLLKKVSLSSGSSATI